MGKDYPPYVPHHIPVIIELELISMSSNITFGQSVNFLSLVISDLMYLVDRSRSFFFLDKMGTQGKTRHRKQD